MKKEKGEADYDYKYDILFLGAVSRKYERSIELDNVVIDFNSKKEVIGMQIFEASKFLQLRKKDLLKIPHWQFTVIIKNGTIEVCILLKVEVRNKLIEKSTKINQKLAEKLPESEILCEA